MAEVNDNFDRPNSGDLGPDWEDDQFGWGGHSISSNQADPDSAESFSAWVSDTFGQPQFSELTCVAFGNGPNDGCAAGVRMTLTGSISQAYLGGYMENWFDGEYYRRIAEWDDAATLLTSEAINVAEGDVIRIEVNGTALELFINGTSELTTSDPSLSGNQVGMYGNRVGTYKNNWSGGDLAVGETVACQGTGRVI
jgi:hypothetical protein